MTADDLRSMLEAGQIDGGDVVREISGGLWRPLRETFPNWVDSQPAEQAVWFCRMLGQEFGPYTLRELKGLASERQLSPKDEVREGAGEWRQAGSVRRLFKRRSPSRQGSGVAAGAGAGPSGDLLSAWDDLEDAEDDTDFELDAVADPPQALSRPPEPPAPAGLSAKAATNPPSVRPDVGVSSEPAARETAPEPTPQPVDVMRNLAAAQIRAAQAAARPTPRTGSGGGASFDFSSIDWTGKPVLIGGAVVAVLLLGYFASSFGFLSGMNAKPVYAETVELYDQFKAASAGGPEGTAFTGFYGKFKPRYTELYAKIGAPKSGTAAYKVKTALGALSSTIESFKMKLPKDEQQMYRTTLETSLAQLKKEFGS